MLFIWSCRVCLSYPLPFPVHSLTGVGRIWQTTPAKTKKIKIITQINLSIHRLLNIHTHTNAFMLQRVYLCLGLLAILGLATGGGRGDLCWLKCFAFCAA